MLDIRHLRENFATVEAALANRNSSIDLSGVIDLDSRRRALLGEGENLKAEKIGYRLSLGKPKIKASCKANLHA